MVLSICIRGSGNKTNFINYHKYCITGHTRRQWWIGKPWKSKWINGIKRCVCLVELNEHFFLLSMLWAWMCVSEGSSGHALDKLYSILCTFKFKFLTNKKNDIIMQMNKILTLEVWILKMLIKNVDDMTIMCFIWIPRKKKDYWYW